MWRPSLSLDFPCGAGGKEPPCQCRRLKRHRFNPWVMKKPWRRAQQPTPVSLHGESMEPGGLRSIGSQRVRYDWSNLAGIIFHWGLLLTLLQICKSFFLYVGSLQSFQGIKTIQWEKKLQVKWWFGPWKFAWRYYKGICLLLLYPQPKINSVF